MLTKRPHILKQKKQKKKTTTTKKATGLFKYVWPFLLLPGIKELKP